MHKILIAAGGTGGHVFPAQALAKRLQDKGAFEVLFAGAKLSTNKYFRRDLFAFNEISSATFFKRRPSQLIRAAFHLAKGFFESIRIITHYKPDLIVGFGSFHSVPLLVAALVLKVPLVLFESNAMPGKVNRLFSRFALFSCIQFSKAQERLKGTCIEVKMPFWGVADAGSREAALAYFELKKGLFTFLVFGGSQGSSAVNHSFKEALSLLADRAGIQVIHVAGTEKDAEEIGAFYKKEGVAAAVKVFEHQMHYAWAAADLAICRSGAATLSELLAFEVPAVVVPFPLAAEDHQSVNALFLEREIQGGLLFKERELTPKLLASAIESLIGPSERLLQMKRSIQAFKMANQKKDLEVVIEEFLHSKDQV